VGREEKKGGGGVYWALRGIYGGFAGPIGQL